MNQRDYQRLLQFSDSWLMLGLLSEDKLCKLGHEYEQSDDKNTEHYRYRIFQEYLSSHRPLSASMAEALYELGAEDPDPVMGGAMMRDIVSLAECPVNLLEKASASGEKHLVKAAKRRTLLSELSSRLTAEVFTRCLESRDAIIQWELLGRSELSRKHLEQIAESGANRAVRNVAAERLRARRFAA
jgi:hypothetical protein